jgi:hypothetical protein
MNLMALEGLPQAAGPLPAIREAGYDGVQFIEPVTREQIAECERLGLGRTGLGRINDARGAFELAARLSGEGQECATVHVGWGTEEDDEAARLIESVLEASEKHRLPIYAETHRATIFQDNWRTVQFVRRFPELHFNGDFSHWYTGSEMVYGGFENKLRFIAPVLERIRFVHGRIGNPGSIQVNIDDGDEQRHPYVTHFRAMWTGAFTGFLKSAQPGDYICFVPELLAPRIYYARVFPDPFGRLMEESDRWQQSLVLCRIAREAFEEARRTTCRTSGS